MMHPSRRQPGFSLIELMIALVIGLVLMGTVIQVFLANRESYRTSEALSRLQEAGRFALDTLEKDLRGAGYQGCADPTPYMRVAGAGTALFDNTSYVPANLVANGLSIDSYPELAVQGTEGGPAADGLQVFRATGTPQPLVSDLAEAASDIRVTGDPNNLDRGDLAVIADCESADIFRVSNEPGDTGVVTVRHGTSQNASQQLSKAYKADEPDKRGARLLRFVTHRYRVVDTGRVNERGQPIMALERDGRELVEGIETLQLRYGLVDPDDGSIRYVDADAIAGADDWARVVSVRVGVLAHSIEAVHDSSDGRTYRVAGVPVGPGSGPGARHAGDRRMRQAFSTTVVLRNRTP